MSEEPANPAGVRSPTIEWQVAGACNYDCSYCIQSPAHRRGRPDVEQVDRAVGFFAGLPGNWELKCSGGEAFAHPLFLDRIVPGLMDRTPHRISVLTNFSASDDDLERFRALTVGRLGVVSASLHLESVTVEAFVARARRFVDGLEPGVTFVVNQVVLPGRVEEAARCRSVVEGAGLRWFPQLYKQKRAGRRAPGEESFEVAPYPDADALARLLGDRMGPRDANIAPSYLGRRCWSGVEYLVVDKDGDAWRCRSAKRHGQGHLGNVYRGDVALWSAPRGCPYTLCPCTVPANRGMIEPAA